MMGPSCADSSVKGRLLVFEQYERPTIGFLTANIHIGAARALWPGVVEAAQQRDVNLLCFPGGGLGVQAEFESQRNVLYDLVSADNVDGLVSWASTIGVALDPDEVVDFHKRYSPLPIVSLALPMDDIPALCVNSYEGMRVLIAHLIEVISGQPLQEFLGERLFAPLGMADTGFSVPVEKRPRLATMYGHPDIALHSFGQILEAWKRGLNERRDVEATYPATNTHSFARGGYGLFSTAWDYMRFAQMLLNRGELDGIRILTPKIVELMHLNHVSAALLPFEIAGVYSDGYGFGLGSRVLLNVAESGMPGSVGEFGWGGAAKTYYWVDPQEQLIGVLMAQYMMSFDNPDLDFRVLAYQALVE